jgi:hypothetical protein
MAELSFYSAKEYREEVSEEKGTVEKSRVAFFYAQQFF